MSNWTTQRDVFFQRLYELAREDRDVVLVVADMAAPALDQYRCDLPKQFVNVGIAEQNAVSIAAGMALEGKKAFAYAIASFMTLRCLEQIRVNAGIMDIPITVVGMGTGYSYALDGPTHHLVEDISILRALPHLTIYNTTDAKMARELPDVCANSPSANYVRLDKDVFADISKEGAASNGSLQQVRAGKDFVVLTTGIMSHWTKGAIERLAAAGMDIAHYDLFRFPIDAKSLLKAVDGARRVVTVEEHFLPGGMGSAVIEVLSDAGRMLPVKRLGLHHDQGYAYVYGGRDQIHGHYGIGADKLEQDIKAFFAA
jgi:transketolase